MKFAAFGRGKIFLNSVHVLVQAGHTASILGTCKATAESSVDEAELEELASKLEIPFFNDTRINSENVIQALADSNSEVAVSVNWPIIVGEKVTQLFRHGVLNAHAGDLPRYRGNATWAYAILNGEEQIGVCIHQMDPRSLDSGPILIKRFIPIDTDTTVGSLITACEHQMPQMFARALAGLEDGTIEPELQPEDPKLSLRCFPRAESDGVICWEQSAEYLAQLVRASSEPYAGAYTFLDGEKLIVWEATVRRIDYPYLGVPGQVIGRDGERGIVSVLTGENALDLRRVSFENGEMIQPASLIRSMRRRLGMNVEAEIIALKRELDSLRSRRTAEER